MAECAARHNLAGFFWAFLAERLGPTPLPIELVASLEWAAERLPTVSEIGTIETGIPVTARCCKLLGHDRPRPAGKDDKKRGMP